MSVEITPELRRFALQTVIRYLTTFEGVSETQIMSEISKTDEKFTSDQLKNFLTRNARASTYGRHMESLGPAVAHLVSVRLPNPPIHLSGLIDIINNTIPQAAGPSTGPLFPETDLRNWISPSNNDDAYVNVIRGLWKVVRISTTEFDDPEMIEYNISLLNIFPFNEKNEEIQKVKFYQSGKFDEHPEAYNGYLLNDNDRLNFLLSTQSSSNRKITLLWTPAKIGENKEHLAEMRGIARGYASNNQAVANHFFAEFVEGTDLLTGSVFDTEKENIKNLTGVYTISQIEDLGILKNTSAIERMTEWSKKDLVLRFRH